MSVPCPSWRCCAALIALVAVILAGLMSISATSPSRELVFKRPADKNMTIVIVYDGNKEVLQWPLQGNVYVLHPYLGRVETRIVLPESGGGDTELRMTLEDVTASDEGRYECHEGAVAGEVIQGCGATLEKGSEGHVITAELILVLGLALTAYLWRRWQQ